MALSQDLRNALRKTVQQLRGILTDDLTETLEGTYGVHRDGRFEPYAALPALKDERERETRDLLERILPATPTSKVEKRQFEDSFDAVLRSLAFTHLNRLVAFKLMEDPSRKALRETVGHGPESRGFKFYLADHPSEEALWKSGRQDEAYRHFLLWQCGQLDKEIGILFDPDDLASRVFPRPPALKEVVAGLNHAELALVWAHEEAIGWVYQYYTPKELREKARKESAAPRNSYEMAFRNQFYTPEYVVRFLVDNTLGRIWYQMRAGDTALKDKCEYLAIRPEEVVLRKELRGPNAEGVNQGVLRFLEHADPSALPDSITPWEFNHVGLAVDGYQMMGSLEACGDLANKSLETFRKAGEWRGTSRELFCCLFFEQRRWRHFGEPPSGREWEEILALYRALRGRLQAPHDKEALRLVPWRPKKDPRAIRIIDPACGSGHFLLYAFELLEVVYREAYEDIDLGAALHRDWPDQAEFEKAIPKLIVENNLHGIDIDRRAVQLAALTLFLKARSASPEARIDRSRIVRAEPMPGERGLFEEFKQRELPKLPSGQAVVGRILDALRDHVSLAAEAGSLLQAERELERLVVKEHAAWSQQRKPGSTDFLFPEMRKPTQSALDFEDVTDEEFWQGLETRVAGLFEEYAREASGAEGAHRRLFARDGAEVLRFLDTLRQRYDVVLMNPPFGDPSLPSKEYIDATYPRTRNDVYAAFVERWLGRLVEGGRLGAITSRTGFFLKSFVPWREQVLLGEARIDVIADLGYGVLDTAMVETAAYVLEKTSDQVVA